MTTRRDRCRSRRVRLERARRAALRVTSTGGTRRSTFRSARASDARQAPACRRSSDPLREKPSHMHLHIGQQQGQARRQVHAVVGIHQGPRFPDVDQVRPLVAHGSAEGPDARQARMRPGFGRGQMPDAGGLRSFSIRPGNAKVRVVTVHLPQRHHLWHSPSCHRARVREGTRRIFAGGVLRARPDVRQCDSIVRRSIQPDKTTSSQKDEFRHVLRADQTHQ